MTDRRSSSLPWLKLSLIPDMTGVAWRRLGRRFGSPESILSQSRDALTSVVGTELARQISEGPEPQRLQAALDWSKAGAREILSADDDRYPSMLLQSAAAPPILYIEGRSELLQRPSLAVVGSRNATAQGVRNASALSGAVAAAGVTIVSGLALGIDTAAHAAALDHAGSTIAVLGCGADVVYPKRNAALMDRIRTEGLIVSEFPLGTPPIASNFPRRNRIISGVAHGCLVVEAAMASGSLITARLAVEMGRDVFAVPGSIHSPLSRGCHYLIRQGAKLVETAEDILEDFGLAAVPNAKTAHPLPSSIPHSPFLALLGYDPCDLDSFIDRCGSSAEVLLPLLTQWEIDGLVSRLPDGTYQRVK